MALKVLDPELRLQKSVEKAMLDGGREFGTPSSSKSRRLVNSGIV